MKTFFALLLLASFLLPVSAEDKAAEKKAAPVPKCAVCEEDADTAVTVVYEKKSYAFCCGKCRDKFNTAREASLYQQLGGKAAINAAVDIFYKKVLADERINYFFEDVNMKKQHNKQKAFLATALGGPEPWTGKDMRAAHKNLPDLKESHFNAVAENLQATLVELKVPEKLIGEVMTVVGSVRDDVLNRPKPAEEKPKAEAPAATE